MSWKVTFSASFANYRDLDTSNLNLLRNLEKLTPLFSSCLNQVKSKRTEQGSPNETCLTVSELVIHVPFTVNRNKQATQLRKAR